MELDSGRGREGWGLGLTTFSSQRLRHHLDKPVKPSVNILVSYSLQIKAISTIFRLRRDVGKPNGWGEGACARFPPSPFPSPPQTYGYSRLYSRVAGERGQISAAEKLRGSQRSPRLVVRAIAEVGQESHANRLNRYQVHGFRRPLIATLRGATVSMDGLRPPLATQSVADARSHAKRWNECQNEWCSFRWATAPL